MRNDKDSHSSLRDFIPIWGWILIFLIPLLLSEFMFYVASRWFNLIAFPIVWIAFWWIIMYRSDWKIFKKKSKH
jgi:hypothetical protein